MIVPSKYENLEDSWIMLGYEILKLLKKKPSLNIELVYKKINMQHQNTISLNKYFDVVMFLWLGEMIEVSEYHLSLKV